ncbi:MAG: DNA primase [Candidatus Micrarchaeota archaeon]|nr:DNA primase [Candidatus Micrarchaeota archaeon]MDE1824330.1 DNA primase [Candidatus Micrarchaeota archaeon]
MAKSYLEIVKYLVESKFTIDGVVDKPDIIGAVFGQTEGLLGNDLDLRELQKNGKIGRIEIEVSQGQSKTFGKLFLPASLDRIETCILAAAIESVDRVGPYEAQFSVDKVEDTRSEKRRKILLRAKELLKNLLNTEIPDSREISEMVQADVRVSEVVNYGPENLPAGPDIAKSDEVIIVEGRADVLNLLRNDIANGIAVGGATSNIPRSIITLANEKESTLFLDGDRGGDMILRGFMNVADIDFIARAPDGKEVEDLTRKEIIKALRTRIPADQYPGFKAAQQRQAEQRRYAPPPPSQPVASRPLPSSHAPQPPPPSQLKPAPEPRTATAQPSQGISAVEDNVVPKIEPDYIQSGSGGSPAKEPPLKAIVFTQLGTGLDELSGTLRSRLYDNAGNVMKEIPIRDLLPEMQDTSGAYAIVLDGVITQRLVELAVQRNIKAIYGIRANPLTKRHADIVLYTKEQGKIE